MFLPPQFHNKNWLVSETFNLVYSKLIEVRNPELVRTEWY